MFKNGRFLCLFLFLCGTPAFAQSGSGTPPPKDVRTTEKQPPQGVPTPLVAPMPGISDISPFPSTMPGTQPIPTTFFPGFASMGGIYGAKKPAPGSLEEMIDTALKNNPDILAAEAKVNDKEAELNRVRHQVVAKLVSRRNDLELAKKILGTAQKNYERLIVLSGKGAEAQVTLVDTQNALEKQRAVVRSLEEEIQALLGSLPFHDLTKSQLGMGAGGGSTDSPMGVVSGEEAFHSAAQQFMLTAAQQLMLNVRVQRLDRDQDFQLRLWNVQTPMADLIRTALAKKVKFASDDEDVPIKEAIKLLREKAGIEVPFRVLGNIEVNHVTFMKAELPVGAWLQVMQDSAPELRFVIREYGILVTTKDRIPENAMTVQEFWKRGEKAKTAIPDPNPPNLKP